ncbi:MAG: hypothetical protein J5J06_17175 [Phycisphaerae bacterium]|nr:hypothetical protein [Phycisphaerae bacterium]
MNCRPIKRHKRLLVWGTSLTLLGGCLPDNYFALTTRNVAVAITDGLISLALSPLFDSFDPGSNGGSDNANDNSSDGN